MQRRDVARAHNKCRVVTSEDQVYQEGPCESTEESVRCGRSISVRYSMLRVGVRILCACGCAPM